MTENLEQLLALRNEGCLSEQDREGLIDALVHAWRNAESFARDARLLGESIEDMGLAAGLIEAESLPLSTTGRNRTCHQMADRLQAIQQRLDRTVEQTGLRQKLSAQGASATNGTSRLEQPELMPNGLTERIFCRTLIPAALIDERARHVLALYGFEVQPHRGPWHHPYTPAQACGYKGPWVRLSSEGGEFATHALNGDERQDLLDRLQERMPAFGRGHRVWEDPVECFYQRLVNDLYQQQRDDAPFDLDAQGGWQELLRRILATAQARTLELTALELESGFVFASTFPGNCGGEAWVITADKVERWSSVEWLYQQAQRRCRLPWLAGEAVAV